MTTGKTYPYFRGVFIRIILPTGGIRRNESGIINLNNAERPGTHWVAKKENRALYFDSFDNLRQPKELVRYLENNVT